MKQKRAVNMKVSTGTADEFFERSLERARKIDRGEKLIPEITLTFEDPAEMMQLLSTQRVRIIECLRKNSVPISWRPSKQRKSSTLVRVAFLPGNLP